MNHYETLGIEPSASYEEIRAAYKRLSQKHHPDKTNGNLDKYLKIQAAYSILSDPIKRDEYDHGAISPAESRLIDLFTQVILSGESDILHHCRIELGKAIKSLKDYRIELHDRLEWTMGMQDRVTTDKGHDRYRDAAIRCVDKIRQTIKDTEEEIARLEEVAGILATYLPVYAPTLAYKR